MISVRYKLVEFVEERKGKKKSLDIVPSNWICYDSSAEKLVARYMPPPYDEENCALLHSLIECTAPPAENWPTYQIMIRGEAKTYSEGMKKLKKLQTKEHVFSTDEECTSSEKVSRNMEFYKNEKVLSSELWDVPELVDENDNSTLTTTDPDEKLEKTNKRSQKEKIRVVENKLLKEPLNINNITDKQGTSMVLLNEMLPVIDNPSFEDLKTAMNRGFLSQTTHLTQLSAQIEELKAMMKDLNTGKMSEIVGFSCPAEKYDLDLPIKNLEAFEAFDAKLLKDEKFRDDMICSMWRIASICVPMQQTIRDIFKKFLSRDIVLQFTAVKDTGKKKVLCKTKFFSCVQDVVIAKFADDEKMGRVSTKDFEQAVGKVINNAKDWEGNRATRKKNVA